MAGVADRHGLRVVSVEPPPFREQLAGAPRLAPTKYLWDHRAWQWQPPAASPVPDARAFTPANNARALRFALRAIEAQPLAYARVVGEDTAKPFFQRIDFVFPAVVHGGLPVRLGLQMHKFIWDPAMKGV